jgi:hypothetical protein
VALIETIVDDFGGSSLDVSKWTPDHVGGGSHSVGGGLLTLTLTTDPATDRAGIVSVANDLQLFGSSVYAKINASLQANVNTEFIVRQTGGNGFVRLRYYLGYFLYYAYAGVDGSVTTSNIFSYDAPTMKYWRIRGAGTTIYFDTSANGTAWTQQASVISNWGNTCRVEFNINGGTGTRSATIDSVNVAAAPLPTTPTGISEVETLGAPSLASFGPPISGLIDDFTGAALDTTTWITDHTGGTDAVGGGLLTLSLEGSATKAGILSVISYFRLTGSAIFTKINPAVTGSAWTEFAVRQNGGSGLARVRYFAANAFIYCDITSADGTGISSPSMSYDPNVWRYWRIRADNSGGMFIDSSPNATTWTQQAAASGLTWGSNCRVSINVNSGSGSRSATIDAVNIVPAPLPSIPASIGETETLGTPGVGLHLDAAANSIADPEALGTPGISFAAVANPATITDPETLGGPGTSFAPGTSTPASLTDPETFGPIQASFIPTVINPAPLADPETFGSADLSFIPQLEPDTLADAEAFGEPFLPLMITGEPDSLTDDETLDDIHIGFQASEIGASGLTDPETFGLSLLIFYPSQINPTGITDPLTIGTPTADFMPHYNGAYNTGTYSVGPYSGIAFDPHGIVDLDVVGRPDLIDSTYTLPNTIIVAGITDGETFGQPTGSLPDPTNLLYGMGTYNEGPYYGSGPPPVEGDTIPNLNYGYGTYGYGIYYGALVPDVDPWDPIQPLFPEPAKVAPPLHILGIGPWSSRINWRGAPNYKVRGGQQPARPAMALPPTTGKGFTLRLGDGSEARCELAFPRQSALVIDEMDTDLWWRRKDPRTGHLEMIGRFNTAHVSLSTTDTGISCSVQFVDYQTILGERMVLDYLDRTNSESQWKAGTPIMQILAWALPKNTCLDLSDVDGSTPYDLGKTTEAFHLPPDTNMSDLMDNLNAISPKHWEWWVETPLDIHQPPKLRFQVGERGRDKGVTLFDLGSGPTPIAEWTRNAASDEYANALYYTGGDPKAGLGAGGGVVEIFPTQIEQYGQRDALYGNSSVDGGNKEVLRQRANRKLETLADRRASYTIRLAQGFWRGRDHIDVGDLVGLRLRMGLDFLHEKFRVSELTVDIDDNGLEEVSLNLGRLTTSADPRSKRSPIARVVRYLKTYVAPNGAANLPTPDD